MSQIQLLYQFSGEDLPEPKPRYAAAVEVDDTFLLVGGYSGYSPKVMEIVYAYDCGHWLKLPQNLSVARAVSTAIVVPQEIFPKEVIEGMATCSYHSWALFDMEETRMWLGMTRTWPCLPNWVQHCCSWSRWAIVQAPVMTSQWCSHVLFCTGNKTE